MENQAHYGLGPKGLARLLLEQEQHAIGYAGPLMPFPNYTQAIALQMKE